MNSDPQQVHVLSRVLNDITFHFVWLPEHVADIACRKLNQFSVFALYQHKAPYNWIPPANTMLLTVEKKWSPDIAVSAYHGFASCSYAYISKCIWDNVPTNCVRLCVIHFTKQATDVAANNDTKQDEKKDYRNLLSTAQMVTEIKKCAADAYALVGERKHEDTVVHQKLSLESCTYRLLQEVPSEMVSDVHSDITRFWRQRQIMKNRTGSCDVTDSHALTTVGAEDYQKWYAGLEEIKEENHRCHDMSPEKYRIDCSAVCRRMRKLGCYVVSLNDGMQHQWPTTFKPSDPVFEDVVEEHLLVPQTHRMRDPTKDIASKYPLVPDQPLNNIEYSARASFSAIVPIPLAAKLVPELWHSGLMSYYHVIGDFQDPAAVIDQTYHTQCQSPYFVRIGFLLHSLHAFYTSFPSMKSDPILQHLLQSTNPKALCELNIVDSIHGRPLAAHLHPVLVDLLGKMFNKQ